MLAGTRATGGAMATTDRPTGPAPGLGELRCKRRACRTLLARVIGGVLVCLDGTRVGPLVTGLVVARPCPRCGCSNVFWL